MRVLLAAVVLGLSPALALPQSLGDAARSEAKKRVSPPAAAPKAYTDVDLRAGTKDEAQVQGTASATPAPPLAEPEVPAPAAVADPGTTPRDPVREALDRETENRKSRERAWKDGAVASLRRLERAEFEYRAACGPNALQLSGG